MLMKCQHRHQHGNIIEKKTQSVKQSIQGITPSVFGYQLKEFLIVFMNEEYDIGTAIEGMWINGIQRIRQVNAHQQAGVGKGIG